MNAVREFIREIRLYAAALGKWLALAAVTGVFCGFIGSAFHLSVGYVTKLRGAEPWLPLPLIRISNRFAPAMTGPGATAT